jgi:hypothetical protein
MPGLLVNGTSVKIFYRDDYNYSYDIVTMVNYYIDLHKYKKLKAGLGVKIFAIRDMLIRVKSYYVDDFYNPTVVYPFFKSNLDFVGGFKKPGFVFSASYPLSRVKDKFDLGVLVNIMPYPIANGDFTIENTYANSNGTTKLYGSSIGVDFRYNF